MEDFEKKGRSRHRNSARDKEGKKDIPVLASYFGEDTYQLQRSE
jgi:hypothetical protein